VKKILRIGIFTAGGIGLIIWFSVYVNDHPYWHRACNKVPIHVDDATGLRRKSPVKTLGLEIGYIKEVLLDGDKVLINVCVTGPVKLTAETRAYIRTAGFLGDKFLELKPMAMEADTDSSMFDRIKLRTKKHTQGTEQAPAPDGAKSDDKPVGGPAPQPESNPQDNQPKSELNIPFLEIDRSKENEDGYESVLENIITTVSDFMIPSAYADDEGESTDSAEDDSSSTPGVVKQGRKPGQPLQADRDAEVSDTVKKVGKLVDNLALMVGDLREVTKQKDFKETIHNLNTAMKHLEILLRPEGKTVKNLNLAMESLKNTMASAEKSMKKISDGEGTIGKFVNDPSIYDDLKAAIKSINLLLGKAGTLRTFVDLSAWRINAYDGNKARFSVIIQPNPTRYYLLGVASDPRGRDTVSRTTTVINGGTATVEDKTVNEEAGLKITALFGKYFGPLDLRVGVIENSGAVGAGVWFDEAHRFGVHMEGYSPSKKAPFTARVYARAQVWSGLYFVGGVDQMSRYNGSIPTFFGAGLFFDDDDLKYLLAFK
jgi:phospholipid/cholesterol/gamma-HCH transport system substrate-binding protein